MTEEVYVNTDLPRTDPRLGRVIVHDPRSRNFAFKAPAGFVPKSVRHYRKIPVLDQGNLGSCTGNSGIGCMGTGESFFPYLNGKLVTDWSQKAAVKLYSEATKVDPFPGEYLPTDTGSSGLGIAKVLKARGWIDSYQHVFTFNDLLAALTDRPVITGNNWYEGFFEPDADGVINFKANDSVAGGHEWVLDEIDVDSPLAKKWGGLIGATNSWGPYWGSNGRFYIPFSVMKRLLSEDGDVTVFVPLNAAPEPRPSDPVVPVATASDKALWASLKPWAIAPHSGTNKTAATTVKKWAAERGLS